MKIIWNLILKVVCYILCNKEYRPIISVGCSCTDSLVYAKSNVKFNTENKSGELPQDTE